MAKKRGANLFTRHKRASLYSRRYYWSKKLKKAKTKRDVRKARHVILSINAEIAKLNTQLGIVGKILKRKPRKKITITPATPSTPSVIREVVKIWEARGKLSDILKGHIPIVIAKAGKKKRKKTAFKQIAFGSPVNKSFPPTFIIKIFDALSDLEDVAYSMRGGTPFFVFIYDLTNYVLTIEIY